ncbi:putative ATP-dependent RNA helicase TDRD12 [Lonchura striata]|uniref:RNA helicase n=1 Tax=Lonchura striata TaxID=40157 RepID=A0A218UWE2_9PASE|nr:putative ATP-dependent RNA helicase TDRD12 [Lonchura striata domestica]
MEQFYNSSKDADEVKQEEIEKGQVYVVFSEELKCWCRALVKSVRCHIDGFQLVCFLVDYAKYCYVASENIRVLVGAFAKISHRAKKCRLHCTKPLTLHIDYCENTAKIGPAKRWDTAAVDHFRKLLEEATEVKATIQTVEDKVLEVFLFVTIRDEKICVNDDLVAKHFAHYKEGEGPAKSSSDVSDDEVLLDPECVPVEFVGPTFLARPKLPFGEEMSSHLGPGEVVVTTPYNLQRLLEHNTRLLYRVCHLVLDETEVLFSDTFEQMCTILTCYKKATAQAQGNLPHQIIAVGTQWNKHITPLIKEFMTDPYIVITVIEEAAIFGNVQQVVQPCMNSNRTAELLKILDFTQKNFQKVLIFTDSITEVEMIHKDSAVNQEDTKAKSVILLTENSSCHAPEILYYLKRAEAEIPEELYDLTARVQESEEDEKFSRPLCASLKTFGICRNRTECPDRHQINLSIDMAQNIADEMIETLECVTILPLFIVHATNYFGRIVKKQKDQYAVLAKEMNDYFKVPGHRISVNTMEKSVFYGLREGAICHRVQVVENPAKDEENVYKVTVKYIDEGRTSQVNSDQLLHLPLKFQSLPPQAVEIIVCRVKPVENEAEWNPKVTDHISSKIKGKLHHAKVIHALGKTVWVDPMIGVTSLPSIKMWINEYNIRSEILSTGLGTDNPEHVGAIQKLCRQMPVLDHAESLECLPAKPETTVEKFGTSVEALLVRSTKEDTAGLEEASSPQAPSIQENTAESFNSPVTPPSNDAVQTKEAEDSTVHQQKSAYSEGKLYVADLELYQSVIAEKSTCVIKDTEAVILLVKEKKGAWCKLLKNKVK